jgi:hypothetical protein
VYWKYPDSRNGGHLEGDNRDGSDAEYYRAECGVLTRGDIRFAVGFYAGDGPVEAKLLIKVAGVARTFPVELDLAAEHLSVTEPMEVVALRSIQHPKDEDGDEYDPNDQLIDDHVIEFETLN